MAKIIDCFMFWNEIELLFIRLDILYDYVDKFIICEAKVSHSGKIIKDEYNFIKNRYLYEKYLDKIIFIPLPESTFSGKPDLGANFNIMWPNENFQRKSLFSEIKKFSDETLVAISDVDEIWDPKNLTIVKENVKEHGVCGNIQRLFYYYLNCIKEQEWKGTYFINRKNLTFEKIQTLRNDRWILPAYVRGGWHFSWMGGVDKIKEKFNCIAEHDIISKYSSEENIIKSITEITDLFNRTDHVNGIQKIIDITNEILPNNINIYIEKFPHFYYKSKD